MSEYQPPQEVAYPYVPPQYTGPKRPGKVQAIAIMTLIDGILSIVVSLLLAFMWIINGSMIGIATYGIGCLLIPICSLGCIYGIVTGILAIVYGAKLLPEPPKVQKPGKYVAIMEIINIINLNMTSMVIGILALIFYSDPQVKAYFAQIQQNPPPGT
jgi:hypothetical protein